METTFRENQEAFRQYFSESWLSFDEFLDDVEWLGVRTFDPENIWTGKQHTMGPREEVIAAKHELLSFGISRLPKDHLYFEFGVRTGTSMKHVSGQSTGEDARFFGFDTFEGFPSDGWVPMHGNRGIVNPAFGSGAMAVKAIPSFEDKRVQLFKGVFQDTLPGVLEGLFHGENRDKYVSRPKFVNVDCDTYSGALYILTMMDRYLRAGDVVYFDEFTDTLNEYAAFSDYVRSFYRKSCFKLIGRAYDGFLFQVPEGKLPSPDPVVLSNL